MTDVQRAKLFDSAIMALDMPDAEIAKLALKPIGDMVQDLIKNQTKISKQIVRSFAEKLAEEV